MGNAVIWLLVGFVAGFLANKVWGGAKGKLRWYHAVLALIGFAAGCLTVAFLVTSLAEKEPRAALLGTVLLGLLTLIPAGAAYRLWPRDKAASKGSKAAA